MKIIKLLLFVFILIPPPIFAQDAVNAPLVEYAAAQSDSIQIEALITQSETYIEQKDFQLALEKLAQAFEICEDYEGKDYTLTMKILIRNKIVSKLPLDSSLLIIRSFYGEVNNPRFYSRLAEVILEIYRSKFSIELAQKALTLSQKTGNKAQEQITYTCFGYIYNWLSDFNKEEIYRIKSLKMARAANDSLELCKSLYYLGNHYTDIWHIKDAEKYLEEALSIARAIEHKILIERIFLTYKSLAIQKLDLKEIKDIEEQIKSMDPTKVENHQVNTLSAIELEALGRFREAIPVLNKSHKRVKELGMKSRFSRSYHNLASCYQDLGIFDTAAIYYQKAINYGIQYYHHNQLSSSYLGISNVYFSIGDSLLAKEYLQQFENTLNYFKQQNNTFTLSKYLHGKSSVAKFRGQRDSTIYYRKKHLALLHEKGLKKRMVLSLHELGEAYLEAGDLVNAYKYTHKALKINQKYKQEGEKLKNLIQLSKITLRQKAANLTLKYAQESFDLAQKHQSTGFLVDVYQLLADANEQAGNYQKALKYRNLVAQTKESLLGFPQYKQIVNYHAKVKLQESELEKKQLQLDKEALKNLSQRRNFMILGLIILVILILIIAYILKEKAKINAQRDLRVQITKDIHDDVGGIINNLKVTAKEALEQKADAQLVEQKLNETIQLGQAALKSLKDLVWKLENQQTTLQQFKEEVTNFSEKMFAITNTTYQLGFSGFKTASSLSPKIYHHVLMIYKEALQNIIKHGQRKGIQIDWQYNKKQLQLKVENPIATHSNDSEDIALSHNGLKNIKKRVHLINGTAAFKKEKNNFSVSITISL